jgi:RNA polymerase sigma-70 factor (ECF subfamily)
MMHDPDAELIMRVGRGDRAAAAALMARHVARLLALSRRMLGDPAEAEDAVQDAFIQLWTHASRWEQGRARIGTWLYRVTLNKCYDRLRRRPTTRLEDAGEIPDSAPSPETALQDAAIAAQVEVALAALPARQRAAIQLCHFGDCGNIEAAEILGVSVEALESLLSRGRRTLRDRLEHLKDR